MTDLNALVEMAKVQVATLIAENNSRAEQIRNIGNLNALVQEVRDDIDTEDETILAYRAWIDKAEQAILDNQAKVEAYIREQGLVPTGDVDVEAVTADWKANAEQIKAVKGMLKNMPGGEDVLKDLPEVKGIPGTRSGGGATGGRRPRFQSIAYSVAGSDTWTDVSKTTGEGDEAKVVTNLSVLAALFSGFEGAGKVSASDLQSPLFAAAGTEDLSTLNGKPVEFAFGVADKQYIVKVTPKVAE